MIPRRIVVATDFQPPAARALDLAATIAQACGAELILVHAYDVPPVVYADPLTAGSAGQLAEDLRTLAEQQLGALAGGLASRVRSISTFAVQGTPAERTLNVVRQTGADMIVVGTHGRTGLPRALLGSTAERLVRTSPVPVLVAHAPGNR
jgi:nucleotide-binding universal stress UspA family protein